MQCSKSLLKTLEEPNLTAIFCGNGIDLFHDGYNQVALSRLQFEAPRFDESLGKLDSFWTMRMG